MSGTGASIGYSQNNGFEASVDILGANAFNWDQANGLSANTNWGVDYKRAQKREEIEAERQKKLLDEKDKFVKEQREKHPEWRDLSPDDLIAKYAEEIKEQGGPKDKSREGVWENVAGFFEDKLWGYTKGDSSGYIDKGGKFVPRTCFVAGTLVKTKDGYKAIETVQSGDVVASANQHTGVVSYKKVKQTFIRQAPRIYKLTYNDGTSVETTGDHPFFIQGKGWTTADHLANGDISPTWAGLKKSDGVVEKEIVFSEQQDTISDRVSELVLKESLSVVDIEVIEEETTVYNFEVEDDHTYFVTEAEVWVHNAEGYVINKEKVSQDGLKAATENYLAYKRGSISKASYEAKLKYIQSGNYDPNFEYISNVGVRYNTTKDGLVETEFGGILPLSSNVNSKFGPREINGYHWGVDLRATIGTELPSTLSGSVTVKENDTYGKHIFIDDGKGNKVLYAHLSEINFKNGALITKGQIIGKSGDTGYFNEKNKETGKLERKRVPPHLHYAVFKDSILVDPMKAKMD